MSEEEKSKILSLLVLMQLTIFQIDEMEGAKIYFHGVKQKAAMLTSEILKQEKSFKILWEIGDTTGSVRDLLDKYEVVVKEIVKINPHHIELVCKVLQGVAKGEIIFEPENT